MNGGNISKQNFNRLLRAQNTYKPTVYNKPTVYIHDIVEKEKIDHAILEAISNKRETIESLVSLLKVKK